MQRRAGFGARLVLLAAAWIAGVALQLQQRTLWPSELHALLLIGGLVALGAGLMLWRRPAAVAPGSGGSDALASSFGLRGLPASTLGVETGGFRFGVPASSVRPS